MDMSKRFENLSPNKQALLALELERRTETMPTPDEGVVARSLIAYVVPKPGKVIIANQLRGFLKQRMPDYMLPDNVTTLNALPVTPNGKIDRASLSRPAPLSREFDDGYLAPRTELEEELTTVWAEVLRLDRVGVNDNFFDLGGHSLLATRLISRIHDTFRVDLPLRTLFEKPSIAGLAVAIVQRQAEQVDSDEIAQILSKLE